MMIIANNRDVPVIVVVVLTRTDYQGC